MSNKPGKFAKGMRKVRDYKICELRELFSGWLNLSDAFGAPKRKRLFFPLTDVLAVSFAGAFA